MVESNFVEALYDSLYSNVINAKKIKSGIMKQWGGKIRKLNIKNANNYNDIEKMLGISMNVYHKNKLIHKSSNKMSKHANLVFDNERFHPLGFMNGGENDGMISQLFPSYNDAMSKIVIDLSKTLQEYISDRIQIGLNFGTSISDLNDSQLAQIDILLRNFVPTIEEINFINIILEKNSTQVKEFVNLMLNMNLPLRILFENEIGMKAGGPEGARRSRRAKTQETAPPDEPPDEPPTPMYDESQEITQKTPSLSILQIMIGNMQQGKMTMTIAQFLKIMVFFCFMGALILNPIFNYVGFQRLMDTKKENIVYELNLPHFYSDHKYDMKETITFSNNQITIPRYEQSEYASTFKDILQNPTYMITNVLPYISFTSNDITNRISNADNVELQLSSEISTQVIILEKMYQVMLSNKPIGPINSIESTTKLEEYFKRLFGPSKDVIEIDPEVFRYMNTALSSIYEDKKQEVFDYNRKIVSKYKDELVKIVVDYKYNKVPESKLTQMIKKTLNSYKADYDVPSALSKVNNIKYCLTESTSKNVVNCIQTDILSERDLLYSKTYFEFIEFFNKMGLMYNQMYSSSKNLEQSVKKMIVKDVPELYQNNIHIGIIALKNELMNVITEALYNSEMTPLEKVSMNNLKVIGSINIFDLFLQMYSNDIKETMGGTSFMKVINKLTNAMNSKTITSFANLSERVMDSIRNDIKMKEKLFLHTNYDTDVLINFMRNINFGESLTTQAMNSVRKTNIDLFVEIKVKNLVLQILSMIKNASTTKSTEVLTNSFTDLFYIIPYYSYKHKYSVDFSGGARSRKYSQKNKNRNTNSSRRTNYGKNKNGYK